MKGGRKAFQFLGWVNTQLHERGGWSTPGAVKGEVRAFRAAPPEPR